MGSLASLLAALLVACTLCAVPTLTHANHPVIIDHHVLHDEVQQHHPPPPSSGPAPVSTEYAEGAPAPTNTAVALTSIIVVGPSTFLGFATSIVLLF